MFQCFTTFLKSLAKLNFVSLLLLNIKGTINQNVMLESKTLNVDISKKIQYTNALKKAQNSQIPPIPISLSKQSVSEQCKKSDMLLNYVVQQVRPSCIVRYTKNEFPAKVHEEQIEQLKENSKNTYSGEISLKGRKTIEKRINCWHKALATKNSLNSNALNKDKRYLVFLTLTLCSPQFHTDKYVKEFMLKPFVRILREKYNCENYLWKAESQKNGNIHFHLIIDRYIDKIELATAWNKIQDKKGYMEVFYRKFGHTNPPSIQIEKVRDNEKMESYISKYISKDENSRLIKGAIWKMSKKLIGLRFYEFIEDNESRAFQDKLIKEKQLYCISKEKCEILVSKTQYITDILTDYHLKMLREYYFDMFNYLDVYEGDLDFPNYIRHLYSSSLYSQGEVPLLAQITHPLNKQLSLF